MHVPDNKSRTNLIQSMEPNACEERRLERERVFARACALSERGVVWELVLLGSTARGRGVSRALRALRALAALRALVVAAFAGGRWAALGLNGCCASLDGLYWASLCACWRTGLTESL